VARLIPSFTDDRTPAGERDVFTVLAAGPDEWVAIHSLDLAPWNRGLRTEIDFVLIVPDAGILCIEVKSHETIRFENDRWYPTDIKRSPFKQACDASHTFHRRLSELAPRFRRVPVVHCCIFPRARFDLQRNLSVQPWELIDVRAFHRFQSAEDWCEDLKTRMRSAIVAEKTLTELIAPLSPAEVAEIVNCCLPIQRRRPEAREEIRRREEEIERVLRQQQKPVLELAVLNPRLIVNGAAGTGKTLISMEVARRAAEKGRRVGLLCFNQLIGDWMKGQVGLRAPDLPNLVVGRAIRVMADMVDVTVPENPSQRFWESELPDAIEERITDPDIESVATFDSLVLDEAQDLLARPWLFECLGRFLEGGFEAGAYCIFGDCENQVLGDRSSMDRSLASLKMIGHPVLWNLSENCRNYRIVGESAVRLSGLNPSIYAGYLRSGGGIDNYDIFFYASQEQQAGKVAQWLKEFKSLGYRPEEITLLSFCAAESSVSVELVRRGFRLQPAWQTGPLTSYTTVHAFKGLENKIIILTDVILNDLEFQRHLFYVGLTRASESVRILCDRSSQDTLLRWISEKG
jgi:hypothetical protein